MVKRYFQNKKLNMGVLSPKLVGVIHQISCLPCRVRFVCEPSPVHPICGIRVQLQQSMQEPIHIYLITCEEDQKANEGDSWVDALQQFLELALAQLSKKEIRFTQKTTFLSKDSYGKHSILLPIISTNLLQSDLDLESVSASGNPVFKVVKNPVEQAQLPPRLASLLAYNFFYFNPETGLIEEYEQFSLLDSSNAFWGTLVDLAYDILESVSPEELSFTSPKPTPTCSPKGDW